MPAIMNHNSDDDEMRPHRSLALLSILLGLMLAVPSARAEIYKLDMGSDRTGDFRLAQIGDVFGMQGETDHQQFYFEGDRYILSGHYGQSRSVVLTLDTLEAPLEGPGGYIHGDVHAVLNFRYLESATNSDVALSLRQQMGNIKDGPGYNTYPVYYVRLLDNSQFQLVKQFSNADAGKVMLESTTIENLDGQSEYTLLFSAVNDGANGLGDIVRLQASLLENGVEKATLSYTDTPESQKPYDAKTTFPGGYAAIAAGQGSQNDGTFQGIEITGFRLSAEPIPGDGGR